MLDWNHPSREDFGSEDFAGCFIGSRDLVHYGECCPQDDIHEDMLRG